MGSPDNDERNTDHGERGKGAADSRATKVVCAVAIVFSTVCAAGVTYGMLFDHRYGGIRRALNALYDISNRESIYVVIVLVNLVASWLVFRFINRRAGLFGLICTCVPLTLLLLSAVKY